MFDLRLWVPSREGFFLSVCFDLWVVLSHGRFGWVLKERRDSFRVAEFEER